MSGFGESKKLTTPFSLDDYVTEVRNFITTCNIDGYDILAHSFGGRIAMRLALNDCRAQKIVLTGSAGLKPKRKFSYYYKVYCYKILKRFLPTKALKNFGSSEYKSLDEVMKKSYLKIVNEHQDKEVKDIKNPTLIIYGEKDSETPVYMAKRLNKYIKNSTLRIIKGAGHFAFIDNPFAFNLYLKEFLLGD